MSASDAQMILAFSGSVITCRRVSKVHLSPSAKLVKQDGKFMLLSRAGTVICASPDVD